MKPAPVRKPNVMTPSPSAAPIMNPAQARGARGLTAAAMIAHISVKVPMTSQMKPPNFVVCGLTATAP